MDSIWDLKPQRVQLQARTRQNEPASRKSNQKALKELCKVALLELKVLDGKMVVADSALPDRESDFGIVEISRTSLFFLPTQGIPVIKFLGFSKVFFIIPSKF